MTPGDPPFVQLGGGERLPPVPERCGLDGDGRHGEPVGNRRVDRSASGAGRQTAAHVTGPTGVVGVSGGAGGSSFSSSRYSARIVSCSASLTPISASAARALAS